MIYGTTLLRQCQSLFTLYVLITSSKYIPYDNRKYQSLFNNTHNIGGSNVPDRRGSSLVALKEGSGPDQNVV